MNATPGTESASVAAIHPEWAQRSYDALAEAGYRLGGARRAVVDLLAAEGGCVDAEHVAARLRDQGRPAGTASVYRALNVLSELGMLHRAALPDGPARFELVLPDGEHHHHVVCDRCGRTAPFTDPELEEAIAEAGRRTSFEVRTHDITLRGVCERCRTS
ncbi:MAG: Fur family transcriptional regulator [Solirubrobacterales bacterium]